MSKYRTGALVTLLPLLIGLLLSCPAAAQTTYKDNFGGRHAELNWIALGKACLTAGNQSGTSSESNPIIPSCASKNLHTDPDHKGALMLTPAVDYKTGAILSAFTFPMNQGLRVTFTTYSYGSTSNGPPANLGADGIAFFLTDGTKAVPTDTGATGGAMGYSCSVSNNPADSKPGKIRKMNGIAHGYLGLGMDEWGNFLNSGDNSGDGAINTNVQGAPFGHGGNGWFANAATWTGAYVPGKIPLPTDPPEDDFGPQFQPNRIGIRGAGNVNMQYLHMLNPSYYRSNLSDDEKFNRVSAVCASGKYKTSAGGYAQIDHDYALIKGAYKALPENEPLAHPNATSREDAVPITYRIQISREGILTFSYSYNNGNYEPVLANQDISHINGEPPSAFRFGFSAGTGGQNNVHEITCFKAAPLQSQSSAGSNTVTGKVTGDTQFFLASYSDDKWWGSLVADPLVFESDGTLSIGEEANWDAKCTLTGGPCDSMGVDENGDVKHSVNGQSPSSRHLLTWNGSSGIKLTWNNLTSDQKSTLNKDSAGTEDGNGKDRLKWLRGNRSDEQLQDPPGDLRARRYVLGDIINSSPTFVGAPLPNALPDTFTDGIHASASAPENGAGATVYSAFAAAQADRLNVVYVGSNDGFLHGFRAGSYDANGDFDNSANDGREVVGYLPHDVLKNQAVNLTDPEYHHAYTLDATPAQGNVFYGGTWHTWLVGGVGSQGQEIYALDVTNPGDFSGSQGAADVIGDWDQDNLSHLGNTVGEPIIVRLHNGQWAIVFGSGMHRNDDGTTNSDSTAGIYIGLIDSSSGSVSFQFLDTGVGSSGDPDGIAYVSAADLDGDHIVDYLYAGDSQGNLWRFDVTSTAANDWHTSRFGGSAPQPLFVAKDSDGTRQPITTAAVAHTLTQYAGLTKTHREMVYFGTGRKTAKTSAHDVQYAKDDQTFYGIWDWHMGDWNNMAAGSTSYESLSGPQSMDRSSLLKQAVVDETTGGSSDVEGYRTLPTTDDVCWKGASVEGCGTIEQYGWYFDLPGKGPDNGANASSGEQIIYSPIYSEGAVIVNTAIPPVVSAFQCNPGLQTGWTMAFNPATGGGFDSGYFANASGESTGGDATVGGVKLNGTGTPGTLTHDGKNYLVTQTVSGKGKLLQIYPPTGGHAIEGQNPGRVSWREMVNP